MFFFAYKKLAQFAVRGALPPRRSESPVCTSDNKPSCVLHLLDWFIGSCGFSSLGRRPEFWVLQAHSSFTAFSSLIFPVTKLPKSILCPSLYCELLFYFCISLTAFTLPLLRERKQSLEQKISKGHVKRNQALKWSRTLWFLNLMSSSYLLSVEKF